MNELTMESIKAEVAKIVADAIKPIAETQTTLAGQQKVLADTLAALPPAGAEKKEEKPAETKDQPKAITSDDVAKIVADAIKADREAQQQATASSAKKSAARQKTIDGKLKGVPEEFLASLPDTDDEAALNTAADKIAERVKALKLELPDVGGAAKGGGATPGQGQSPPARGNVGAILSEGAAKFAAAIKIPA